MLDPLTLDQLRVALQGGLPEFVAGLDTVAVQTDGKQCGQVTAGSRTDVEHS